MRKSKLKAPPEGPNPPAEPNVACLDKAGRHYDAESSPAEIGCPTPGGRPPRTATVDDFHAASRGTFHVFTFAMTPWSIESLREDVGRDMSCTIGQALAGWVCNIRSLPEGKRPICIDCDREFSDHDRPARFTIAVPFTAATTVAMMSGICCDCFAKPGLKERILRRLRAIWPGTREVEGGHA